MMYSSDRLEVFMQESIDTANNGRSIHDGNSQTQSQIPVAPRAMCSAANTVPQIPCNTNTPLHPSKPVLVPFFDFWFFLFFPSNSSWSSPSLLLPSSSEELIFSLLLFFPPGFPCCSPLLLPYISFSPSLHLPLSPREIPVLCHHKPKTQKIRRKKVEKRTGPAIS